MQTELLESKSDKCPGRLGGVSLSPKAAVKAVTEFGLLMIQIDVDSPAADEPVLRLEDDGKPIVCAGLFPLPSKRSL